MTDAVLLARALARFGLSPGPGIPATVEAFGNARANPSIQDLIGAFAVSPRHTLKAAE